MPIPKLADHDFPSPRFKLRHLKRHIHHHRPQKSITSLWKMISSFAAFAFLGLSASLSSLPPHYGLPSQNLTSSQARKSLTILGKHPHSL